MSRTGLDSDRIKPDILVDTNKVQRAVNERSENPFKVLAATFHAPAQGSLVVFGKVFKQKVETWLSYLDKRGWELKSGVRHYGPFPAYSMEASNLPILDMKEWRVRAVFKNRLTPKPSRIELDPLEIKQDRDDNATSSDRSRLSSIVPDEVARLNKLKYPD